MGVVLRSDLNRVTRIISADERTARFTYDGAANAIGKRTRMDDPEGTTDYAYDGFGRLAAKTQALKNGASQAVRYSYSTPGRPDVWPALALTACRL